MKNNHKEKFTVLIAEDEHPAMEYLSGLAMKHPGLKVEGCVMDGKHALDKLSKEHYDILFLDINLPVISGVEILKQVKNPPYVIFTTAFADPALNDLDLLDMDYLYKPFSEDTFNNTVEKAINILSDKTARDSR